MNQRISSPMHGRLGDGKPTAPELPDTHLSGWPLLLARTVAFAVIAVTVGLGFYALTRWQRLAIPCRDAQNSCLMTPEQAVTLSRLGITPMSLALGVVLLCCAAIALTNGVAALLLWRRSDDAMALLVAVTLVLLPAFFTPMYQTLTGPWRAAAGALNVLGGISFLLLVSLFPSGRLAPRWIWAPTAVAIPLIFVFGGRLPSAILLPTILAWLLSLIGGQIYRYRRASSAVQRQQTKWAVAGIVLAIVVNQLFWQPAGWIPALARKDSLYPLLLYPDFVLLICIVAACFGVAILRYRLYDIDIIIRRTLIYGALTAILVALYFGIVIGAQLLTQRLTGEATPPQGVIVATTLLIAALFSPLRLRVQAVIDRAFYRSKYDTAATLSAFGAKLRTETDLPVLCDQLIDVVEQTMQPEHVHLWLRDTSRALDLPTERQERIQQAPMHLAPASSDR
ncbi:MAG TPA: hypothetical protein VF812_19145 [Ktedonobacterales bacterium]